jgi:5-dehydro-2-deoxygluconokinase
VSTEIFDVITTGRVGIDLYPLQSGVPLDEVSSFARFLGGSATNVAVAAARYGRRSAVITRTGSDPFGRYVHEALRELSVDDRWVTDVESLPTPITFCELFPPDRFPIYFYRWPKAPDMEIYPEELDLDAIAAARVFWVTVTGLSAEPSRSAVLAALEARQGNGFTVLDLDYRPTFWSSSDEASRWANEALRHVNVAIGNIEECEMAVGTRDAPSAAAALVEHGVELAVVKQGPKGVLAVRGTEVVQADPLEIEVVNGLGAGDAFGGALCHGLLADWELGRAIAFANAAGAIVASRLACAQAMPDEGEVMALMKVARHA